MKTRAILVLALVATVPFLGLAACSGDNSQQQDGGPQNKPDTGTGTDTGTGNDTGTTKDAGPDAPNACATGVTFDNTLVPGWPNNIPQP